MKPIFYSSKEEIRNRVLKNAEYFWNIKDSNDFDPLVKLIIEALSNELFNVSNDVKNLENRIFDKVSRILAPDHLTSALPAHAIMHARSFEQTEYISPFTQFSFKKNIPQEDEKNKNKKTDIFFSPLHTVRLHNAELKYMVTGNTLYSTTGLSKVPLMNTLPGFYLNNNSVYIGINGIDIQDLSGFNLFFDWRNYAVPQNTYDLLSLAKCFIEETQIPVLTDRFMTQEFEQENHAPFHNKQLLNLLKADVLQYYSNRFVTLDLPEKLDITELETYPKSFDGIFQPSNLSRFEEKLVWLKLVFPAAISQEMLNELNIHINAFPVVNKKLSQIKHRLKTMNNIIPAKTEELEQMLVVESLKDNKGKTYNEIPYTNENDKGDGSFSIRFGGTERFDNRNAKELVDYLFELLRDEKAAFSAHGPDFLSTALKNLEQNITLIEQKSRTALKAIKELPTYIVVKPIDDADILFLDIWITQAEDANRINIGSRLGLYENNKLHPDSIFLLSQTKGGRSRLNSTNRVQAYKYGLTTADRVVTKADVINFCKYELGSQVADVHLEKGLMLDTKPGSGFLKTTDIIIEPSSNAILSDNEWAELLELTLAKLKLRSTMNVNYRMTVKSKSYK